MSNSVPRPWPMAALLLPLAAMPGGADEIRSLGVVGNSGVEGDALVRVGEVDWDNAAGGVAFDAEGTLWVTGGDAINRLGLDGHLIERHPVEPPGTTVDGRTFAVLGQRLYCLARLPDGAPVLLGVDMAAQGPATPTEAPLPPRRRGHVPYVLSPQPLGERLVVAAEPEGTDGQIGVYLIAPMDPAPPEPALLVRGEYPQGLAVDGERGVIYLGANLGLFVGGETHSDAYSIAALTPQGQVLEGFPAACTKTPAIPTQFRGVVSLAGGALWDAAWYGFLARLDLQGKGAPGRVVEWHHGLGYPGQVTYLGGTEQQLLAVAVNGPEALYVGRWDGHRSALTWAARLGCLPVIASLGLSDTGWITVGTARCQLWWRWEDAADAPPRKAELHIGVTPVHWDGDRCFAFAAQYKLSDLKQRNPVGTVFTNRVGNRNEASRVTEPVALKALVGCSVSASPEDPNGTVYVTEAETRQLHAAPFWVPELKPDNAGWAPVEIQGRALTDPTDVCALTDGRLLLADAGAILLLEPRESEWQVAHEFRQWGNGPGERLGDHVRFSVTGPWMLVSDTTRHRVLWLDWTTWGVLGQLGDTDMPGSDRRHLNSPEQIALQGTRALVADAGNQRVMKVELAPEG